MITDHTALSKGNTMTNPELDPCLQQCFESHQPLSNEELVTKIQTLNCTQLSDAVLRNNHTRKGLLAILCNCICNGEANGGGDSSGEKEADKPKLNLDPPHP